MTHLKRRKAHMDFQAQPEAYDLLIFGSGAGSKLLAWTFAGRGSVSRWWSASMSDPAQTSPNLRAENRLPTQADGAARSEFERAARSGTLRAPPTTTPPKPAEATLGFSSTERRLTTRRAGDIAPI